MGWRRRVYIDQWPGRGPFSYLPPWQRPGRIYGGRGDGGWWRADPNYAYQSPILKPTIQDEIAALEESKNTLGEEKASIEQEINDIETQLKELKTKLVAEKKPPTGQ